MLAVIAEFECDIIQQRTKAGLESTRKRVRLGGRPVFIGRRTIYKVLMESK